MAQSQRKRKVLSQDKRFRKAVQLLKFSGIEYCLDRNMPESEGSFISPSYVEIGVRRHSQTFRRYLEEVISTICHEYSHWEQFNAGIWKTYLTNEPSNRSKSQTLRKYLRTALRCERDAEKKGKKLMKELFPDLVYRSSYFDENIVQIWKEKEKMDVLQKVLKMRRIR